jgi:lipid A 4'-phosphatase
MTRLWFTALLASSVIFTVAPQIDIAFSSLFYGDGGFVGTRSDLMETVRLSIWTASVCVGLFALVGALVAILRDTFLGSTYRVWNIAVAVYILGPGIAANFLLKSYWGRARPASVEDFGGAADFTSALWPTDNCESNCSFVSGEASGAAAAAVAIWLLSAPISSPWLRRTVRVCAVAIPIVGSALRVAAGRHFLSDVVFAVLIVTGIALVLLQYRRRSTAEVALAAE